MYIIFCNCNTTLVLNLEKLGKIMSRKLIYLMYLNKNITQNTYILFIYTYIYIKYNAIILILINKINKQLVFTLVRPMTVAAISMPNSTNPNIGNTSPHLIEVQSIIPIKTTPWSSRFPIHKSTTLSYLSSSFMFYYYYCKFCNTDVVLSVPFKVSSSLLFIIQL